MQEIERTRRNDPKDSEISKPDFNECLSFSKIAWLFGSLL